MVRQVSEAETGNDDAVEAAGPAGPQPSRAIRVLWWCDVLMPTLGAVLIFMLPGLVVIAAVAAFIVVVDSVTDRHLTPQQRLIGLSLAAGPIVAALLGVYIAGLLGYFGARGTVGVAMLTLAAAAAWALFLFWAKPRAWQITKQVEWKS